LFQAGILKSEKLSQWRYSQIKICHEYTNKH
jgi:hypothetical protein